MYQHVSDEAPGLVPLVRVVDEYLGDRARGIGAALSCIVAEEHYLHERDKDHADGRRPAGVFFLVGAVCVREVALAMGFGRNRTNAGQGGTGRVDFFPIEHKREVLRKV